MNTAEPNVSHMTDPLRVLQDLGRGVDPSSLGLAMTTEGRTDLRQLTLPALRARHMASTPVGPVQYVKRKPTLQGCRLRKVDLSAASIADSYWQDVTLEDVTLARARARGVTFASGSMEGVSFTGADLRDSAWGQYGVAGPDVSRTDFTGADLRHSHHSHPSFTDCRFVRTRMEQIDFRGARFQACTFEGRFVDLRFRGRFDDPDPAVAALVNPMREVDFSQAELVNCAFLGIDLRNVRLPIAGYLHIPRPRIAFSRALERVEREWPPGPEREKAAKYLRWVLAYPLRDDVPLYLQREADLLGPQLGPDLGARVLEELRRECSAHGPPRGDPKAGFAGE